MLSNFTPLVSSTRAVVSTPAGVNTRNGSVGSGTFESGAPSSVLPGLSTCVWMYSRRNHMPCDVSSMATENALSMFQNSPRSGGSSSVMMFGSTG